MGRHSESRQKKLEKEQELIGKRYNGNSIYRVLWQAYDKQWLCYVQFTCAKCGGIGVTWAHSLKSGATKNCGQCDVILAGKEALAAKAGREEIVRDFFEVEENPDHTFEVTLSDEIAEKILTSALEDMVRKGVESMATWEDGEMEFEWEEEDEEDSGCCGDCSGECGDDCKC